MAFRLRPKNREVVAVRVIEVGGSGGGRDVSWFVSELDFFRSQRLIGGGYVLNREDDLAGAGNLAAGFGRRLAEAQGDRASVQKRETGDLILNLQAQLVAIERQRALHILNTQHNNADFSEFVISMFHVWLAYLPGGPALGFESLTYNTNVGAPSLRSWQEREAMTAARSLSRRAGPTLVEPERQPLVLRLFA